MYPTPIPKSDNRNRTRAEVDDILARLDQSGLTAAAFSRREGLNLTTLYSWLRRRRDESKKSTANFIAIDLPERSNDDRIEVVLTSGHTLRIPNAFDEQAVCRLVGALSRAC